MTHKATMFDTLRGCWNDLRWCINLRNYNLYSTDELQLTVDLSDINVLEEGRGIQRVHLHHRRREDDVVQNGNAHGKRDVRRPRAQRERIPCRFPERRIHHKRGPQRRNAGSAAKNFWVTNVADMPRVSGTVYQYGLSDEVIGGVRKSYGASVVEYSGQAVPEKSTI